ncbi:hypothetical protein C6376_25095 [Streptomyces sp. P3]|nr:hypothetical protein C6376_25095 [Streptomyces sp. P3]
MSQLSAFKRLGEPEEVADVVVFLAYQPGAVDHRSLPRRHRRHACSACVDLTQTSPSYARVQGKDAPVRF